MPQSYANCTLAHRVSYGETDAMGVVYYAEYIHYFERARGELCRSRGYPYSRMEEAGYMLPVREAQCRYYSPARYDDLIKIHVQIDEIRKASIVFSYKIYDEADEKLLCTGMTHHAFVNKSGRPVAVPENIREIFSQAE